MGSRQHAGVHAHWHAGVQNCRVPTNLESQGIWVVRESQGILDGVGENVERKKKHEINKRTRNKKRTRNTIYNIDIYYIIRTEFL